MIGLLLPAVQAAREAARRMECTNKIKQLCLGVQEYADACTGHIPAGCGKFGANGQSFANVSAFVMILPYLEEAARYDKISTMSGNPYNNGNDFIKKGPAFLLCPSEGAEDADRASNYCASYADFPDTFPGGKVIAVMSSSHGSYKNYCYNPRAPFVSGLKFVKLSSIADGLSNTALFSERVIGDGTNNIKGSTATIGITSSDGIRPSSGWTPNTCAALRDTTNHDIYNTTSRNDNWTGTNWADGRVQFDGFNTILPPNSPSCADSVDYGTICASASSGHSGGVNVGRCDGSVSFVSDTVDCGDLSKPIAESGASPYGVWGALGSIKGKETTTQL